MEQAYISYHMSVVVASIQMMVLFVCFSKSSHDKTDAQKRKWGVGGGEGNNV